jgi:hypothetical protein
VEGITAPDQPPGLQAAQAAGEGRALGVAPGAAGPQRPQRGGDAAADRGLVLDHFADPSVPGGNNAIHITGPGATGIVIAGNYIGTDPTGAHADWNSTGVWINGGASGNTVGGTTAADRNVISGNLDSAVALGDSGTRLLCKAWRGLGPAGPARPSSGPGESVNTIPSGGASAAPASSPRVRRGRRHDRSQGHPAFNSARRRTATTAPGGFRS